MYEAGFATTFVTAGVFGCLAMVIFYSLRLRPPLPRVHEKGTFPVLAEAWRGFVVAASNRKVLMTSGADAAKMIANGALMAFLPLYGLSVGLHPGEVGLLFTVQAGTSFVSKPIMGRVSDRLGRQPLIMIGLLTCAGTFVGISQASAFSALLLLSAGFGFGEAVVTSSSAALVADSSEFKTLGAGMGMQGTIGDIGHASGPLLAGILIERMSYFGAFSVIAAVQVLAAGVFWITMRRA
jgi:MFS family permease